MRCLRVIVSERQCVRGTGGVVSPGGASCPRHPPSPHLPPPPVQSSRHLPATKTILLPGQSTNCPHVIPCNVAGRVSLKRRHIIYMKKITPNQLSDDKGGKFKENDDFRYFRNRAYFMGNPVCHTLINHINMSLLFNILALPPDFICG